MRSELYNSYNKTMYGWTIVLYCIQYDEPGALSLSWENNLCMVSKSSTSLIQPVQYTFYNLKVILRTVLVQYRLFTSKAHYFRYSPLHVAIHTNRVFTDAL